MDGMDNNIQNGNVPNNDVPMTNNVPNADVVMDNNPNVEPVMNSAPSMDPFMNSVPNGPVMGNVPTNNMDSNTPKKANNKFIIIGIVVAVLLIAGIVGLFGYKSYVGKPINLFSGAIESVYEDVSEYLTNTETFDITKESFVLNGDVKLDSNIPGMEDYTKYTYDFNVGMDLKNKKFQLGASMDDGSKEVIGAILYYLDKTAYIDSDQLYDKVLYMVMDEDIFGDINVEANNIDYKKVDKILEKLSKYLVNGLDEKKFEKESATVKINGKDVKVNKVIYPINQDTLYTMAKSMLEDIKKDDELLGLIADLAEVEKSQIKDALKDLEINKEDFEFEGKAEFCLYTKGFFEKVVGFGFESNIDDEKAVTYYVEDDGNAVFVLEGDGIEVKADTVGNKTDGSIKIEKEQVATFTLNYVEKDKNTKMDLTVNLDIEETKLVLDYSADVTEESDKKAKGSFDVTLKVTVEEQTVEASAKVNLNAEIGGKVEGVNTSGAVNFEELDPTELEKISTNLENALKDTFLYELLMYEDDSYDDYYDDDWSSDDWDDEDWDSDDWDDEDF